MKTSEIDLNDGTYSRHKESHYRNCDPCWEDHLDFMDEMEMDARMDAAEYQNESEED
jgi:hypothetical protein